jgi:hypothetical protein
MKSHNRLGPVVWSLPIVLSLPLVAADEATARKPSQYAPVKDVVAQIDAFLQQIGTDVASEAEYGDDQKSRVAKDANTLVVLAQVLGNHDEDHARKKSASALFAAAQQLAEGAGNFKEAKGAYDQAAAAATAPAGGELKWEAAADLQQLMKQVPIVNNKLRSGVTGRRFDRTVEQNAGLAATLAAIAQASMLDMDYCSGKDEEAKWAKICADMRDAAATVNVAVRKKDQSAATAALERLVKTCDDCHHDFRD